MYPGVPHSYPPNYACHMKRPFCGRFHAQLSIDTYACCHIHMLRSFCGVFRLRTGINAYSCCHITKTPKKTETKGGISSPFVQPWSISPSGMLEFSCEWDCGLGTRQGRYDVFTADDSLRLLPITLISFRATAAFSGRLAGPSPAGQ